MSPKSKLNKTYSGTIDYGETYQYKNAKYWVYLRNLMVGDDTGTQKNATQNTESIMG